MTISIAFTPPLGLPLRSTTRRKCGIKRRVPVALRMVGDPESSKDEAKEVDTESPPIGGIVPPTDFEDSDSKNSADVSGIAKGVAGIADDDDLLVVDETPLYPPPTELRPPDHIVEALGSKRSKAEQHPQATEAHDAVKSAQTKDITPATVNTPDSIVEAPVSEQSPVEKDSKATEGREAVKSAQAKDATPDTMNSAEKTEKSQAKVPEGSKTTLKMTPEQIEKAKATREAAVKAAEEQNAKKMEQGKQLLAKAEDILRKVGTKSRTIELGQIARAKAEDFVENKISEGEEKDAPQQQKLQGSAANAAKSLIAAMTKGWEQNLAPKVRDTLPSQYGGITNKALASAAVGLFVAIALLPSLFSGGGQKPKQAEKKKIDSETATLERKLKRERSAVSSYSSKSASQKAVFPPEEKVETVTVSPRSSPKQVEPKPEQPTAKVTEAPKQAPSQEKQSLPQTSLSSTPKPEVEVPSPPKSAEPSKLRESQPPKIEEVTPALVMTSISKTLGPSANLVSAASFDALAPQPTIVLEVSKTYHKMAEGEQKKLAQLMLQSARSLGYERISLIEVGTGVEVAHAGLDVDLEDESQNLRAQVGSLQKLSDRMAMQNANKEAEIDTLSTRITEEREEFALQKADLEKTIKMLREETSGLTEDLADARVEISKIPDRLALEERTVEAERKSEKMGDTVEMLSIQLSKARTEEAAAKKSQSESFEVAKKADLEKEEAIASVTGQIEQAQKAADGRASERIAAVERDAQVVAKDADKRVGEAEQRLARTVEESKVSTEETRKSFEKQLIDQKEQSDKEAQTIQSKYEAMLDDVQRRAHADLDAFQKEADRKLSVAMKEAKTFANSLTKERDDAQKDVQKVQKQAEKSSEKAEREKQNLQRRIEKLEAQLNKKAPVQEAQQAEAVAPNQ